MQKERQINGKIKYILKAVMSFAAAAVLLTLTSCRGMPPGLYRTVSFKLTDEKLEKMEECFNGSATKNFYYTRSLRPDNKEEYRSYRFELCVFSDEVIWTESDLTTDNSSSLTNGEERAYKDGVLYSGIVKDGVTDKISKTEDHTFEAEEYSKETDFAKALMNCVLSMPCDSFKVERSIQPTFTDSGETEYIIDLSVKNDIPVSSLGLDLSEASAQNISSIQLQFVYLKDQDLYECFDISWNIGDTGCFIKFDYDAREEMLYGDTLFEYDTVKET